MAETKLTKSEEALKKNNPKKFAELMKRKQGSSARRMQLSQQKKAEDAGSRETTAAGAIGAMMAVTPVGMAKAFLVPAIVGKSLVKKGAAKVASTAAAKNAGKASKTLVSKLKKVKDPVKGFDPNKPFVMVKGKATNKIPPSKVSKIAKATPDKPMSRPEKIARVAAGQGQKGRRSGTALRDKKTGKLTGIKDKDARIGKGIRDFAGPATRAAGVLAASSAAGGKKPTSKSTIADVKRKPALPKVEAKPKKPAPKKPVRSGTGRGNMAGKNMGSESISEYFGDMQGRKTKVRLPFGMGTVDVDSTKSAYDNDESVEMGQKKGGRMTTVRRRMGGKVRGYGKAMRGY